MTIEFQDTERRSSDALAEVIAAIKGERVTLRDILAQMGESGLLLLCGLLSLPFLVPVSIPGVSTVFGIGIVLIGIAITFNRLPWLPSRLADRPLDAEKLVPVLEKGLRILRRFDRFFRVRLQALTDGRVVNRMNGLALTGAGVLLMMPLSIIPFSNTLPGVAILLLSAGISQRDGLVVAGGYLMIVLTLVYFAVWPGWLCRRGRACWAGKGPQPASMGDQTAASTVRGRRHFQAVRLVPLTPRPGQPSGCWGASSSWRRWGRRSCRCACRWRRGRGAPA